MSPLQRAAITRTETFEAALTEAIGNAKTPEAFAREWLKALSAAAGAKTATLYRPVASGALIIAATVEPLSSRSVVTESGTPGEKKNGGGEASASPPPYQDRLLQETFSSGKPRIVLGRKDSITDADGSWAYAPLTVDDKTHGVIEMSLPAGAMPDRQRDVIRTVTIAGGYFAEYERRRRRQETLSKQALIDEIDRFVRSVHEKLSLKHTAYVTANDGRRLIGCDRASVLLRRGKRYDVVAVSGVDDVETRSRAAKLLGKLAAVVAKTGEALHFTGSHDDLSPQLREALNEYLDETHVRSASILPLIAPNTETANVRTKRIRVPAPLGILVVEQIEDVTHLEGRSERAEYVAQHASVALAKALEHEAIPLLPLWKACGKVTQLFAPGTRRKTAAVCLAQAAAAAALYFIPADFTVHTRGVLQPAGRHHVFAPLDATVKAIHVRHGQSVAAGQLLLELRNTDLDVAITDVAGQRTSTQEQLLATERTLFEEESKITVQERHRLAGRRNELKQHVAALDEQLRLLRRKRESLRVVSPIAGEVTTWDVEQQLRNRPIRQGQVLIDVADVAGPWELELQVPEDGIGHLLSSQQAEGEALRVSYRLSAEPRTDRSAIVREVHYVAEIRGDDGNTVLTKAALTGDALPVLRPGAEATAKIYCGQRALGYVWLHDAVDFARAKVWFRMY